MKYSAEGKARNCCREKRHMTALGKVLLNVVFLGVCCSGVQANYTITAEEAFNQRYWTTAIELLEGQCDTPKATEMLAIAYFEIQDFDKALPCLEKALAMDHDGLDLNIDLNSAMMEIQLALRQFSEASLWIAKLKVLGSCEGEEQSRSEKACHLASFGQLRITLSECDPDNQPLCQSNPDGRVEAKDELGNFVHDKKVSLPLRLRAANTLIEALLTDGELGPAYQVAEFARSIHPDPENAIRYAPFIPENQASSSLKYDFGYRFEYDDNVTFPDDILASGQGDSRHVLMADVLYERSLRRDWSFYASGNFLQSFYNDLDQFDRTHVAGSIAVGHMGQRTGWRIPLELTYVWLDGDSFRNSVAMIPGFYIQFGDDFLSHFYARLQHDDYDWLAGTEEDRSGDVAGAGVLLTGQVTRQLRVRSYLEFNRYDSDGIYWKRDETVAFIHGEYDFTSRWQAALAFRYKVEDFDNVRPVFADRQLDKSKEIFLNITHKFAKKWRWRGQVSLIDHDSNIPIFDYDRNIYSIAVTRDF